MKSRRFKKLTAMAMTCAMTLSLISPYKALGDQGDSINLQVLATSDTHGKFLPWDYAQNVEDKSGSLAQLSTAIKGLKEANPNTILVDAGDTIQGNSADLFLNDEIHPMVAAMNEMGYDTWTLGNHEFNYGIPALEKVIAKSKATVLSANVYKKDGARLGAPYKIVEKAGIKIGIIGAVTSNITRWDGANLKEYKVSSAVEETKKAIAEIKDKVDIMIAVEHMGENNEYDLAGSGAKDLAAACPELTAIVAAHEHKAVESAIYNNIHLTENKDSATTLAKMDIKLVKKEGKYVVANKTTDVTSKLIYVKDSKSGNINYAPDAALTAVLSSYDKKAKEDASIVIGKLNGGDLVKSNEVKGIPTAQIQETAMIDLINAAQMYYGKADVAAAAAFSDTANITQGDIKKSGTSLVYKYPNTLYLLEMTGKQLKQYMEWSANFYNTYKSGDLTISFNQNVRGYNYDMFSGVKYNVDISKAPGSRIVDLRKNDGTPIKDTDTFKIAVNNYRANSQLLTVGEVFKAGDTLPTLLEADVKVDGVTAVRDFIGKYIKEVKGGVLTPEINNNWKVIGNNWDTTKRAQAVELINNGKISIPKSEDGRTANVSSVTEKDVFKINAKKINIVSFNDFHGALTEEAGATGKNVGAAKLAGAINAVKAANKDTIVVAAGDLYQGSAPSNLTYGAPVSEMIKAIGVTASAVGNHEFDWGTERIAQWAKAGEFDFLASNIYDKTTGKPVAWAQPYKIVEKGGVKIGLIGLATPETTFKTNPDNVKTLEFRDAIESAKEWATYLRNVEKVDTVIALSHLGAMQDATTKAITGEAADLANAGIVDGVICGHTHMIINGFVKGTPIVQGYCNGRSLAQLTLVVDGNNKVVEIVPSVDNLYSKKATLTEDPEVKAIVDKYNAKLKPILSEVVGKTDIDLTHDRTEGFSKLGTWATTLVNKVAGTQIAILNGGGLRAPIPKGDITMGTMYSVMPFDNTIVKMELKGSDLKRVIENGIGNTEIGWVQFSGITVTYDLNLPFGNRITSMKLEDGTAVDMDKYYAIATIDFMYIGGDKYDFKGARNVVDTGVPMRDSIASLLSGRAINTSAKILPKTGAVVDTTMLVELGSVVMLLGIAMFITDRRKKRKEENAA